MLINSVSAIRATTETERQNAIDVLSETYLNEKHWVKDEGTLFPESDLGDNSVSWFVAHVGGRPAGVVRVLYDPPLEVYASYGFQTLRAGLDVGAFVRENRIAEIGRFAVRRRYRNRISVVAALMRTATEEAVRREYTHYITDVFEGEAHSPYEFHTRVIGFQPVATHDTGELNCPYRRITLVLNLKEAYNRLRQTRRQVYQFLTKGWDEALHQKLSS